MEYGLQESYDFPQRFDFTSIVQAIYSLHAPEDHYEIDCKLGRSVGLTHELGMYMRGASKPFFAPGMLLHEEVVLHHLRKVALQPLLAGGTHRQTVTELLKLVQKHGVIKRLKFWISYHLGPAGWELLVNCKKVTEPNLNEFEQLIEHIALFLRANGYRSEFTTTP